VTIGRFVCESPDREAIWKHLHPAGHSEAIPIDSSNRGEALASMKDTLDADVRREFAEAGQPLPPDAETHLDLAIAYLEMALVADALGEAGTALRLGQLPLGRASAAIGLLFDEKHLRRSVSAALDLIRESLFQN
jgi:hypothetical protein